MKMLPLLCRLGCFPVLVLRQDSSAGNFLFVGLCDVCADQGFDVALHTGHAVQLCNDIRVGSLVQFETIPSCGFRVISGI